MINITFKDVGQGDSIIIDWEDSSKGIAIIDCNLYNGKNPVLDHIIKNEIKLIDLIILSHPHYDHFSGMLQLLNHCFENDIHVKKFIHTCDTSPERIKSVVKGAFINSELTKLFKFLADNFRKMNMKVGSVTSDLDLTILLSANYKLSFLSPSVHEINKFITGATYDFNEESPGNNPNANYLSTVTKIETVDGYILLTSDAYKTSLHRIDKIALKETDSILLLGQAPHHGAGAHVNHSNAFWKKRVRNNQTPIVFSVGKNGYKHVSSDAVDFFSKNDYDIFSTNPEGSLRTVTASNVSTALNAYSTLIIPKTNKLQGDKLFRF